MSLLTRTDRTTPSRGSGAGLVPRALAAVGPGQLALARTGAGVVMVARPTALTQGLGVDSAASARTAWAVQMLGAREIALGVGTVLALRADRRAGTSTARAWVSAGAFSDALDVLAVGGAVAKGRIGKPAGGAVVLSALAAAVVGVRGR